MANVTVETYRPTEDEPYMNPRQTEYFRKKLLRWREDILRGSGTTLQQLKEEDTRLPDQSDWASAEIQRSYELRTRDRERKLLTRSTRRCGVSRTAATATARRRSRSASGASRHARSRLSASRRRSGTSAASACSAKSSARERRRGSAGMAGARQFCRQRRPVRAGRPERRDVHSLARRCVKRRRHDAGQPSPVPDPPAQATQAAAPDAAAASFLAALFAAGTGQPAPAPAPPRLRQAPMRPLAAGSQPQEPPAPWPRSPPRPRLESSRIRAAARPGQRRANPPETARARAPADAATGRPPETERDRPVRRPRVGDRSSHGAPPATPAASPTPASSAPEAVLAAAQPIADLARRGALRDQVLPAARDRKPQAGADHAAPARHDAAPDPPAGPPAPAPPRPRPAASARLPRCPHRARRGPTTPTSRRRPTLSAPDASVSAAPVASPPPSAPAAHAPPPSAAPAPDPVASLPQATLATLPGRIVAAVAQQREHVTVQLDPADLGRVDVALRVDGVGTPATRASPSSGPRRCSCSRATCAVSSRRWPGAASSSQRRPQLRPAPRGRGSQGTTGGGEGHRPRGVGSAATAPRPAGPRARVRAGATACSTLACSLT